MSSGNLRRHPVSLPPIALHADLTFHSPELSEGLSYWRAKAAGRAMPLLSDIRPEEIPHLVPYLSLIEIRRENGAVELFPRLAGSKLEEVFGPIHRKPLHTFSRAGNSGALARRGANHARTGRTPSRIGRGAA